MVVEDSGVNAWTELLQKDMLLMWSQFKGGGGLGHLAIQYAKRMGFKTIELSRGTDKKEIALKLGAQVFIDTQSSDVAQELQKLGGASVILATSPDNKAIFQLINGPGFDGKLVIVAGVEGPIQIFGGQLLHGRRSVHGWVASGPDARKDTINFSLLTEVHSMIETFPLEQVVVPMKDDECQGSFQSCFDNGNIRKINFWLLFRFWLPTWLPLKPAPGKAFS